MFTGPVLVTGAAGFAGSHLLDALLAGGATVEGWARPDTPAFFGHLPPGVVWRNVELLDCAAVQQAVADSARPSSSTSRARPTSGSRGRRSPRRSR